MNPTLNLNAVPMSTAKSLSRKYATIYHSVGKCNASARGNVSSSMRHAEIVEKPTTPPSSNMSNEERSCGCRIGVAELTCI